MDTRYPNEKEREQLRKLVRSYRLKPLLWNLPFAVFLALFILLRGNTTAMVILGAVTLVVGIYLMLDWILLKRCPRCSAWATVPHGSCPSCGLYLDPEKKPAEISDTA